MMGSGRLCFATPCRIRYIVLGDKDACGDGEAFILREREEGRRRGEERRRREEKKREDNQMRKGI